MTTFTNAVKATKANAKTSTTNGMRARVSSASNLVDFFFKAGAMRGKDIIPLFVSAMGDDQELALRLAQWLRDARGGAGEREHFRNILKRLELENNEFLPTLIQKTPMLGRWDDLLVFQTKKYKDMAYAVIASGLRDESTQALVKKWLPREKSSNKAIAVELMKFLELTPKQYRKLLASSETVETLMCAKRWEEINFSHVPSNASNRYRKAFFKHQQTRFEQYVQALTNGDTDVKVNVGVLYPYEIVKNIPTYGGSVDTVTRQFLTAQWKALPNYVGDAKILPMIDVSGSMSCGVGVSSEMRGKSMASLSCMQVAVSLGMYLSMKNTGSFQNTYLTFAERPTLNTIEGDIVDAYQTVLRANWGGNTNIEAAFKLILDVAVKNKVPQSEMPQYLMILSDMQFDMACRNPKASMYKMAKQMYKDAGYELPNIIFWNINAYDNTPVKFDKEGTALVSGFSPSIVEAVLKADLESATQITPYDVMMEAIMNPKYDL